MLRKRLVSFLTFIAFLLFMQVPLADSTTYSQDGSPILNRGTSSSSASNLNSDDDIYYAIDSALQFTTMVDNPTMNGNVNNWANGGEDTTPAVNSWTYDTGTFVSSPGSGSKSIISIFQTNSLLSGTAYQAPTGTVNSTYVNYLNWSMKFDSLSSTGTVDWAAICAEAFGTINGTANRRLYWCYTVDGSLPSDTANIKYIQLGSGTSTNWQTFSRNIGEDIDSEWGGTSVQYTISEIRLVNRMDTDGTLFAFPTLASHFDDIYLKRSPGTYAINVSHSSSPGVSVPSGNELKKVEAHVKFNSSSSSPTYALSWLYGGSWSTSECTPSSTVGSTEVDWNCTDQTNPEDAISSGTITFNITTSESASSFSMGEDYIWYKIWYPAIKDVELDSPSSPVSIEQGDTFTMSCNYSCGDDYGCSNVNISAQFKPPAGSWQDIGSSGNLVLNGTETNPRQIGALSIGETGQTSFVIKGNTVSSNNMVRCSGTSSNAGSLNGTIQETVDIITPGDELTNLSIWDETDLQGGDENRYPGNQVEFWANYTNRTNSAPINSDGICQIAFDVLGWGSYTNMTYNSTTGLYEYNRSFSSSGTYGWNVSCSKTGYASQIAADDVLIKPTPPETEPPNVTIIFPSSGSNYTKDEAVWLSANATDGTEVDTVIARIKYPDSTQIDYQMAGNTSLVGGYGAEPGSGTHGGLNSYISVYDIDEPIGLNTRITSWEVNITTAGSLALRVYRPAGANIEYVGGSSFESVSTGYNNFSTDILAQEGDYVGFVFQNPVRVAVDNPGGTHSYYQTGDITSTTTQASWTAYSREFKIGVLGINGIYYYNFTNGTQPGNYTFTVVANDTYDIRNDSEQAWFEFLYGNCNPYLDYDWVIDDGQVCDNEEVTTGTGKAIINPGGTLELVNAANLTINGLELNRTGDSVFINLGTQLRVT